MLSSRPAKFYVSFLRKNLCVLIDPILFDGINKLQAEYEKLVQNRNRLLHFSASLCEEIKRIGIKIC